MTDKNEDKYVIHESIRAGKALLVQQLINENPKLLFRKDEDDRTPLHWACTMDNNEIIKILLQPRNGIDEIDIDEMVDASGWTPIHIVSALGNVQILEQLMKLEPTPDINLATNQGTTALHLAISKNHLALVEKLVVEYKCSCRVKDKNGFTGLHRAASIGSQPIVKLLIEHGKVNINAKDNNGWTSLHHALAEGQGDVALLLAKLGADPSIQNNDSQTPQQVSVDEKVKRYFESNIKNV